MKQHTNSTDNCVKVWMDDCGCLDSLESLTVTDESFYTYLDSFIDKHFGYEDNTLATSNASFNNNVQYICLLYNKHFYSFDSILESHFIISFIQSKPRQGVNICQLSLITDSIVSNDEESLDKEACTLPFHSLYKESIG